MLDQTTVEQVGIDESEYIRKGLGTGNSVGKFDPLLKPFDIRPSMSGN